jgi:FMN phosphatase YigB (HAD superfamily)
MKYNYVIFDLFGTLVSDSEIVDKGKMLKEKLSEAQSLIFIAHWRFWHRRNIPREQFLQNLINTRMFDAKDIEIIKERIDIKDFSLFNEVLTTLQNLKDLGIKMAVISNAPPTAKQIAEKNEELSKFIEKFYWSFEMDCMKPEKMIFDTVLNVLAWPKKEVLYVGDSIENDNLGPIHAGLKAVLLDRKGRFKFEDSITTLRELVPLVKG